MNRADLIDWLKAYTPMELELRDHFETYRKPVSQHEFYQIFQKYDRADTSSARSQFRNLDAVILPQADYLQRQFSDTLWLDAAQDISIRKHPRYFPEIRHSHMFVELAYVLLGNCTQTFYFQDPDISETVVMQEGMLCIITPGIEHTISVFDDSVVINILIRTSTMKHALTDLVAGDHALFDFFKNTLYGSGAQNFMTFDTKRGESIYDVILGIMLELCEEKQYTQKTALLMLGLLFTYLQRDYSDSIRFSEYASAGIGYIPQVLSYIHYNYREATVESIAEHFHLSRPYLSRIFKAYTNMTIIQALQQVRLEQACEFLVRTQMSVHEISEAVGYGDVTFFIRVFKKAYHQTPLQYRKQNKVV